MPAIAELSEPEQDEILIRIYALAQYHARKHVRPGYREDMVQNLALEWLERLRAGTWDVKREAWNEFVISELRNHKTADRRKRRREMTRDAIHLETISNARREWMSPELRLEEEGLQDFAEQIRATLPRKCVRAHRLVRDEGMTYTEAAKKLRVSPHLAHDYVKTVHRVFRRALPAIDIEPPTPQRLATPRRARRRPLRVRRNRRRRGVARGRNADTLGVHL